MNKMTRNVVTTPASASTSFNRRKSLKNAPDVPEDIPQNDDEAEREQRRRDSGKFGQLAGKRVSLGGIEFSTSELVAQYTNCMRLSAENKINHKNAFSLPLIDCMKLLLKKKDEQMNNFQVVGCTLDASAKIYASRVDRVHMDGMSFARGLGSRARDLPATRDNASGDDAEEENADLVKKKKIRKRRKLSRDTTKINISLDAAEPDPTYVVLSKQFSNCQPSFISFIPRLKMAGDSSKVFMDMKRPVLCKEEEITKYPDTNVPFECEADGNGEMVGCPFREIMAKDIGDIDYDTLLSISPLDDTFCSADDQMDNAIDDFMMEPMNDNASATRDNVLCNEGVSAVQDLAGWTNGTEVELEATRAGCLARAGPRERVVDLQQAILKEMKKGSNVEYSYMNLDRILFAGPTHWRPLPVTKVKERNLAVAEASKKKEKKVMTMDFTHLQESDIPSARVCTLTRRYIEVAWTLDKVTNPPDLHLDPKKFLRYFNRPRCGVSLFSSQEKQKILPEEEGEDDINDYDYDNLNDSQQFCPPPLEASDGDIETDALNAKGAEDVGPSVDVHSFEPSQGFSDAWSMVDPPNKVARIVVPYAQHAKKVDMKLLKGAIWSVLCEKDVEITETGSQLTPKQRKRPGNTRNKNCLDPSNTGCMTRKVNFSEMERRVMEIVPTEMAQELTMPLIFTALLHLANERVLTLSSREDHSDIVIAQDSGAESFVRRLQEREYI